MIPQSLYLCYFGVREPLVQTQVLPYLRRLCADGFKITLLTFEREHPTNWGEGELEQVRKELAESGIAWHSLRYHKWPSALATGYDIIRGALFTAGFMRRESPEVLHGRAHIPTLMAAVGRRFAKKKPKVLFDIRGFLPEEYTDAGIWPENGFLYRVAKRVEKWLLRDSDGFVVLTETARNILFPGSAESGVDNRGRPVAVIPCCVDLSRFGPIDERRRDKRRRELGVNDRLVVAYVGSFGGWYLTKETADLFAAAREVDDSAFALILTQSDSREISGLLRERSFSDTDMLITRVPAEEVPDYLVAADLAVSFIKRCYSKLASSPTKNAEYLACGLPIIANSGIGDTDSLILEDEAGALVEEFDPLTLNEAVVKCIEERKSREQLRDIAFQRFDLEVVGAVRYAGLYRRLLADDGGRSG